MCHYCVTVSHALHGVVSVLTVLGCDVCTHAFRLLPAPPIDGSADPQPASSGRKSSPPVEDGVGWGLDPLATSEESLAAKKRKAQVHQCSITVQYSNIDAYPTIPIKDSFYDRCLTSENGNSEVVFSQEHPTS